MLRVSFASHGETLMEVLDTVNMLSDLKQQGDNPEQLLANWPLHPAPPRKAYVYTSDQSLAHRGSLSVGLSIATLFSLLETLFLGNASLTSP